MRTAYDRRFLLNYDAAGNKLQSATVKADEAKIELAKGAQSALAAPTPEVKVETTAETLGAQSALAALQSDVQPVGHDYVEEVTLTSWRTCQI